MNIKDISSVNEKVYKLLTSCGNVDIEQDEPYFETMKIQKNTINKRTLLTPNEGPSLETSIFPLSFQVVREPLPFAYQLIKEADMVGKVFMAKEINMYLQ